MGLFAYCQFGAVPGYFLVRLCLTAWHPWLLLGTVKKYLYVGRPFLVGSAILLHPVLLLFSSAHGGLIEQCELGDVMHFHVFVKGPGSTFHLSAAKSTIDIHVNTIAKSIASYLLVVQSSSVDFFLQIPYML